MLDFLIDKLLIRILFNYNLAFFFLSHDHSKFYNYIQSKKLKLLLKRLPLIPAYRDFLLSNNIKFPSLFSNLPITNKYNYVLSYAFNDHFINGKLPKIGFIDESAGSNGEPINWVHVPSEEWYLSAGIFFEYTYSFSSKSKPNIMISAWSNGVWATGIKFSEIIEKYCIVKSCGPNIFKILDTLRFFGPNYNYIIAGYPLFIKQLLSYNFNWSDYSIDLVTGGDGYSPLWPLKLKSLLHNNNSIIVSSYGCSDIDIAIGFETPFAQELRLELLKNKQLKNLLFPHQETIPMIFQYNPLLHYIENLDDGTFAITTLDLSVVAPKIRYNVGDLGGVYTSKKLFSIVKKYAPSLYKKHKASKKLLHLPFLYIYGRKDGTISLDGANIFPDSLDIIFTKYLPDVVTKFKIKRLESSKNPFHIIIELNKGLKPSNKLKKAIQNIIKLKLPLLNKDYSESLASNPNLIPIVTLKPYGDSYFKSKKIKYSFIDSK